MLKTIKQDWFSNIKGDILSGIVVAFALIPEVISFSIIAGVDPIVGLYASFVMAVVISFFGGRPGMISAAAGAMALVAAPLVRDYGVEYLYAAAILTGIIQLLLGYFKVAKLMRFIPNSVMIGFVNALAIMIFMAQVPNFIGINNMTYVFVAITLAIIYLLPKIFKVIPAPLVAIVSLTAVAIYSGVDLRTVGDLGSISQSLPNFLIPNVPFTFETLQIIFPYAVSLAIVGLMESLLTASIVDDMTNTTSDKNQEAKGQGIGNIITGFFGGMPSCAMIGQSVINVKSGGRTRLSAFVTGMFLMFLIMVLGDFVVQIPMPVLVGIMITVSVGTFDWKSFSYLKNAPKSDALVLVVTVAIVVATENLSFGVIAGVILSAIFFVAKISAPKVTKSEINHRIVYHVSGQLFFATVYVLAKSFEFNTNGKNVAIDFTNAHIWDESGVAAINKIIQKYREHNVEVSLMNLNPASQSLIDQLAVNQKESKISA